MYFSFLVISLCLANPLPVFTLSLERAHQDDNQEISLNPIPVKPEEPIPAHYELQKEGGPSKFLIIENKITPIIEMMSHLIKTGEHLHHEDVNEEESMEHPEHHSDKNQFDLQTSLNIQSHVQLDLGALNLGSGVSKMGDLFRAAKGFRSMLRSILHHGDTLDCDKKHGNESTFPTTPTPTTENPAPSKQASEYIYHDELVNFWDARRICEQNGQHLLSIKSEKEQSLLSQYLSSVHPNANMIDWWTSGKKQGNGFVWTSDNSPVVYKNFGDNIQQEDSRQGMCITIQKKSTNENKFDYKWNLQDCIDTKQYFVCEKPFDGIVEV